MDANKIIDNNKMNKIKDAQDEFLSKAYSEGLVNIKAENIIIKESFYKSLEEEFIRELKEQKKRTFKPVSIMGMAIIVVKDLPKDFVIY